MKKTLLAIVAAMCALCLSAVMLAGCSSSSSTDEETTTEEGTFTLTVGFDAGYPPYGFVDDDGSYTGIDLELAAEVCDRLGWELVLEPIDWDSKDALLESGVINCIWNGFTIEGREDSYAFTEPYMLNEQVIVVRADSDISSLEDLAGCILMTQAGSAALDVLEDEESEDMVALVASLSDLQTIADYNNAFMQLESGLVDAVACDLSIAAYQIAANPDAYVQIAVLSSENYGVGFALGQEDVAATVTATLLEMYEDGTVEALCEKYADYGISFDNWVLTN